MREHEVAATTSKLQSLQSALAEKEVDSGKQQQQQQQVPPRPCGWLMRVAIDSYYLLIIADHHGQQQIVNPGACHHRLSLTHVIH